MSVPNHHAICIFKTVQEARTHRHQHGTGGWIFSPQAEGGDVVLFPPEFTPTRCFHHPMITGKSGHLIGSQ